MPHHGRLRPGQERCHPVRQVGARLRETRDIYDRLRPGLVARAHQVQGVDPDSFGDLAAESGEDGVGVHPVGEFELQDFGGAGDADAARFGQRHARAGVEALAHPKRQPGAPQRPFPQAHHVVMAEEPLIPIDAEPQAKPLTKQ